MTPIRCVTAVVLLIDIILFAAMGERVHMYDWAWVLVNAGLSP